MWSSVVLIGCLAASAHAWSCQGCSCRRGMPGDLWHCCNNQSDSSCFGRSTYYKPTYKYARSSKAACEKDICHQTHTSGLAGPPAGLEQSWRVASPVSVSTWASLVKEVAVCNNTCAFELVAGLGSSRSGHLNPSSEFMFSRV